MTFGSRIGWTPKKHKRNILYAPVASGLPWQAKKSGPHKYLAFVSHSMAGEEQWLPPWSLAKTSPSPPTIGQFRHRQPPNGGFGDSGMRGSSLIGGAYRSPSCANTNTNCLDQALIVSLTKLLSFGGHNERGVGGKCGQVTWEGLIIISCICNSHVPLMQSRKS